MPFLEIVFVTADLHAAGFAGRDELEDPLEQALAAKGAAVTGGGGGLGTGNIDVDVDATSNLDDVIEEIRRVLRGLHAPPSTVIRQYEPRRDFTLY